MIDWVSHNMTLISLWAGALATLAIFSVLYKENAAYRLVEHIFIGAAAGYYVVVTWKNVLKPQWWDQITAGHWYWIFALVTGGMFYFIYSQRQAWISKLLFGALLGMVAGMAFKGFAGLTIDWIRESFKPVAGVPVSTAANNLIFILVLLSVMAYFFFSFEHRTPARRVPANIGRWVLMFAFGAMFGSTVMARMSLLIGRVYFLLHDWMHLAR
ncbi:MAG: hypothetical protein ACYC2Y_07970 [Armatimonadota bacterium]